MSKPDVILPTEVEFFIKSLRKNEICEIGIGRWYDMHENLYKINQQAMIEASEYREEFIREQLVLYDKIELLVHEALTISIWKQKILPKLFEIDEAPKTTFLLYSIIFHEGIAISLLELLLFHENCVEGLNESAIDLIDYTVNCMAHLIGLCSDRKRKPENSVAAVLKETTREEFDRQVGDMNFNLGIKSITILNFLIDRLDKCPLSAITRLVQVHDVPCLLSEILHLKPWIRINKTVEKFINGNWRNVNGDEIIRVTKTEAHTWLALRQLLFNQNSFKYYELNDFRQKQIAKCHLLINNQLLDQIPQLGELKHFLCSSSLTGKTHIKNLIIEQLPEIREEIIEKAKTFGWKNIVAEHAKRFIYCNQDDVKKAAERLNGVYNTDFLDDMVVMPSETSNPKVMDGSATKCAKCSMPAVKRCAQCEIAYYCCRECQVQDWLNHKNSCNRNQKPEGKQTI